MSVSIGSSKRDHEVEIELLGKEFRIRREGTDGDLNRAARRFAELDGTVAAMGMGGIDRFLRAAGRTYYFRDAKRLVEGVSRTPVLDGSGLKGAIEGSTIRYLSDVHGLDFAGKKVLTTSAIDRWGLAESLHEAGAEQAFGDFEYAFDAPIVVRKWTTAVRLVRACTPIVVQLPFSLLYPTGSEQDNQPKPNARMEKLYRWADVIAGDWMYVRKFMPDDMRGTWVITNTTTPADVEFARARGVELLVTTTPRIDGRSFGTNVIEATLVALDNASHELEPERYRELLDRVGFVPDVKWLQKGNVQAS